MPQIQDILRALDARFPWQRAEKWDKVGLHIGDRAAPIETVFVAYETSEAALDEAANCDAHAVVVYHPLLFRPLERLDFADPTARLAARMIRENRALICVHTALDGAAPPGALGDALAARLGLRETRVVAASGAPQLVKITTFVPADHLDEVREAMWRAGAGRVGIGYDECSSSAPSQGTFRPLPGAAPHTGSVGLRSEVEEVRLEVLAPLANWPAVVAAMNAAHPYEEVAHDVTALINCDSAQSYGPLRVGHVEAQPLEQWIETVREKLHPPSIRLVKAPGFENVETVACSPGSGASFIDHLAPGTTFVCGDIKHHDALKARAKGITLLDVTHAATETAAVPLMARALGNVPELRVVEERAAMNPFA